MFVQFYFQDCGSPVSLQTSLRKYYLCRFLTCVERFICHLPLLRWKYEIKSGQVSRVWQLEECMFHTHLPFELAYDSNIYFLLPICLIWALRISMALIGTCTQPTSTSEFSYRGYQITTLQCSFDVLWFHERIKQNWKSVIQVDFCRCYEYNFKSSTDSSWYAYWCYI